MIKVSIIICSINRKESLNRFLKSVESGNFKDYELIICEEEGNLVELKDKGWRKANGEIIVFCDDDIEIIDKDWLKNIVAIFDTREDIVGVTGPTFVPTVYLKNRDVFKKGLIGYLYNKIFLDEKRLTPGYISKCGASSHGASYYSSLSKQTHFVNFLEPSQFAVRKKTLEKVNGFDLSFIGVAEWCDVDLSYRIKQYGKLLYHPQVKVYHYPTVDKTTNKRLETKSRYENYCRWSDRYIKKSFRHYIYRLFLKFYFWKISHATDE